VGQISDLPSPIRNRARVAIRFVPDTFPQGTVRWAGAIRRISPRDPMEIDNLRNAEEASTLLS